MTVCKSQSDDQSYHQLSFSWLCRNFEPLLACSLGIQDLKLSISDKSPDKATVHLITQHLTPEIYSKILVGEQLKSQPFFLGVAGNNKTDLIRVNRCAISRCPGPWLQMKEHVALWLCWMCKQATVCHHVAVNCHTNPVHAALVFNGWTVYSSGGNDWIQCCPGWHTLLIDKISIHIMTKSLVWVKIISHNAT